MEDENKSKDIEENVVEIEENKKPDIPPQPEKAKTFTQEQLDHLFIERTKNVKENAISEMLKELGVENKEQLINIIEKQREVDETSKSELQKAQDEINKKKNEIERMKVENEKALSQARELLLRFEVYRAVVAYKDSNGNQFRPEAVEDVWFLIDRNSLKSAENGTFEGISEAVEKIAKDRPHWLIPDKPQISPNGTPRFNQRKQIDKESKEQSPRRIFTL